MSGTSSFMYHVGQAIVVVACVAGLICCHAIDNNEFQKHQEQITKQKQLELEIKQMEIKELELKNMEKKNIEQIESR